MKFGIPSVGVVDAKELLYVPAGGAPQDPKITAMYRKTHGNYNPGE